MPPSTRVLVADANLLFADALGRALGAQPGIEIVEGHPTTGLGAAKLAIASKPDLVVLDYWMREMDGATTTRYIRRWLPGARVFILGWFIAGRHAREARLAGALRCLSKTGRVERLAELLRTAASGDDPGGVGVPGQHRAMASFANSDARADPRPDRYLDRMLKLSPREMEVLDAIAGGAEIASAARDLGVTVGTLRNHIRNTFVKLGAESRLQAVTMARAAGVVGAPRLPVARQAATAGQSSCGLSAGSGDQPISVLVADAQLLSADAVGHALDRLPGIQVIDERPSAGFATAQAAVDHRPDVLVADYWMSELDGPALVRAVHRWCPETKVVLVAEAHSSDHVRLALRAGATAFLPKSVTVVQLADVVRRAHGGESLVYAEELARMVDDMGARVQASKELGRLLLTLSPREVEVLCLLVVGEAPKTIARELSLSVITVRTHIHSILQKTGAVSQQEVVDITSALLGTAPKLAEVRGKPTWTPEMFEAWLRRVVIR